VLPTCFGLNRPSSGQYFTEIPGNYMSYIQLKCLWCVAVRSIKIIRCVLGLKGSNIKSLSPECVCAVVWLWTELVHNHKAGLVWNLSSRLPCVWHAWHWGYQMNLTSSINTWVPSRRHRGVFTQQSIRTVEKMDGSLLELLTASSSVGWQGWCVHLPCPCSSHSHTCRQTRRARSSALPRTTGPGTTTEGSDSCTGQTLQELIIYWVTFPERTSDFFVATTTRRILRLIIFNN
jgi:hypothetical protein